MEVPGVQGSSRAFTAPPRLVALSGAASVVLTVFGVGLADHGGKGISPDMAASDVLRGFAATAEDVRLGAAVMGAAIALSLVFTGVLWERLARGSPWLGVVALAGGVFGTGMLGVHAAIAVAGAVAADAGAAEAARTLLTLEYEYARAGVPGGLVVVGAAAAAGIRSGVFPRWFNMVSLGFAVMLTLALFPVGPAGLIGAAAGIWVVAASILMAVDPGYRGG